MAEYKLSELVDGVKGVICESLELEDRGFTLSTTLMEDLGAESLDYLDIIFRIEKKYHIKIERGRLEKELRAAFPDMAIKQNTGVTPELKDVLKKALPEIDPTLIDGLQKMKEVPATFTIATFVRFTVRAILESDPTTIIRPDLDAGYQPTQLGLQA
jgi:acyl carrier protein